MKTRRPIFIDSLLLTAMVFVFMVLVSTLFPVKLKVFHPIKDAFQDFDYTDFYFSKLKKYPEVSDDIIVVNIGHLNRAEIAHQIEVIHSGNPAVIGLDAIFTEPKDPMEDTMLMATLEQIPVVGISKIADTIVHRSLPKFKFASSGYANFYGDPTPTSVIRSFSISTPVGSEIRYSFPWRVYNAAIVNQKMLQNSPHENEKLKINYRPTESFITIQPYELFDPSFDASIFKDKMVLMGYAGVAGDLTDMEDQHFTPMNEKMAGKSLPDMKGIYIHANILQSIKDKNYIVNSSSFIEWLLTILITFFTSMLMIQYYVHRAKWFHFMSKMVQLFAGVIFLFISIWIMHKYHVKINFTFLFIALVLCADLVYFYDPFAKWLNKRNWFHSEIMKH